ncbi:MAG: histone deacetylase [Actinobacteria bacterium]|nr:histone deacetylase [Actinomycetota bacterium]MBM3709004.1 histone deacetylase [Actinomycetota bacterium]
MYIIYDDFYLKHNTGSYHPENSQRLFYIKNALDNFEQKEKIILTEPRKAEIEEICLVHSRGYIEKIRNISKTYKSYNLDADTVISSDTYECALLAAGGCLKGIELIQEPKVASFFAVVRPPGHHAFRNWGSGFCIFNNIAISALYARQKYNIKKIAIIDFDIHHGNGTQDVFYKDDSVFYASLHQFPHYPGTGWWNETGSGAGKGFNLNVPMVAFSGEDDYISAFMDLIIPLIQKFCPELILVSAGFDGHIEDPLSEIELADSSFYKFAVIIIYLCRTFSCSAGFILEGGYNFGATARSILGIIGAFLDSNLWNNIKDLDKLIEFLNIDRRAVEKVKPQNLKNFENIKKIFNI